jgi:hypothetical protein
MNQYGVKFLPARYEGHGADKHRAKQRDQIAQLERSRGSQAGHRARRRETTEQFEARLSDQIVQSRERSLRKRNRKRTANSRPVKMKVRARRVGKPPEFASPYGRVTIIADDPSRE